MTTWLSILAALVKGLSIFVEYLGQRKLLEAGSSMAIKESLENVLFNIDQADRAVRGLYLDPEWSQRVRDKYERRD